MSHVLRRLLAVVAVTSIPVALAAPGQAGSLPKISFTSSAYSQTESGGEAVITLKRAAKGIVSTVRIHTAGGTATAGSDYTAQDVTITFAKSQMTQLWHIPLLQDSLFEGPETVGLFLGPAVTGAQLQNPTAATLTIRDDETGAVSVSDAGPTTEGTALGFTVTMSHSSVVPMSANWAASNGTALAPGDFPSAQHGSVAFAPGVTTANFSVNTTADGMDEPSETLNVTLSSPSAGLTVGDGAGVGTIADGDAPPTAVVSNNPTVTEGGSLVYNVTLSAASAFTATVTIETWPNSVDQRFAHTSQVLTFLPGVTTQPFSVATTDNALPEADAVVWSHIIGVTNATIALLGCADWDCTNLGVDDAWGYGQITDNDNSGFEDGTLSSWSTYVDGDPAPTPTVSTDQAHSGTQSALLGYTGPGEPLGNSAVYRNVTVPASGTTTLTFWVYELGDGVGIDGMYAQVKDATTFAVLDTVFNDGSGPGNNNTWTQKTYDLSAFAGQTVQLIWIDYEDAGGAPTAYYLDDVSITNS